MTERLQRPPRKASPTMKMPPIPGLTMDLEGARRNLQDDLATAHTERGSYDPRLEIAPPRTDYDGRPVLPKEPDARAWDQIPGYDADADLPPVMEAEPVAEQILAETPEAIVEDEDRAQFRGEAPVAALGDLSSVTAGLAWNLDMEDPKIWDGTPFIGMARVEGFKFGFPMMVRASEEKLHAVNAGKVGEEVICWAWISRDVLPAWPKEPS